MNKEQLLELIEDLKITSSEFTVLSSGALVLRDIYEKANDLDIAVTNKGLQELKENYNICPKGKGWYEVNEKVECVVDDMINRKEKLGKYYVQDIFDYLNYLEGSVREKDKKRIPIVKNYINEQKLAKKNI